jgi:hypothetical protein
LVGALGPYCAHESFGDGVRPWRLDRRLGHPNPVTGEGGGELAVSVVHPAVLTDPTGLAWWDSPILTGIGAVGLTVVNGLQFGVDPFTDGLEVADVAALTDEVAGAAADDEGDGWQEPDYSDYEPSDEDLEPWSSDCGDGEDEPSDDEPTFQRMKPPSAGSSNQAENSYTRYLAQKYGLSQSQQRALHDAITGKHLSPEAIENIAEAIANGEDY